MLLRVWKDVPGFRGMLARLTRGQWLIADVVFSSTLWGRIFRAFVARMSRRMKRKGNKTRAEVNEPRWFICNLSNFRYFTLKSGTSFSQRSSEGNIANLQFFFKVLAKDKPLM